MKYEIIFYRSGKTAEIEKTISSKLSSVEMNMSQSFAATEPKELAGFLSKSLERVEVVIIIGGLDSGKQSTDTVLSAVLSPKDSKMESNKIIDDAGNTAYIIKCLKQTIIILPDETSVIENMFNKKIISDLSETYKLKPISDKTPQIQNITDELDRQLASMSRVRTSVPSSDETPKKKSVVPFKVAAIILGILGIVQLLAAGYLYIVNYVI